MRYPSGEWLIVIRRCAKYVWGLTCFGSSLKGHCWGSQGGVDQADLERIAAILKLRVEVVMMEHFLNDRLCLPLAQLRRLLLWCVVGESKEGPRTSFLRSTTIEDLLNVFLSVCNGTGPEMKCFAIPLCISDSSQAHNFFFKCTRRGETDRFLSCFPPSLRLGHLLSLTEQRELI